MIKRLTNIIEEAMNAPYVIAQDGIQMVTRNDEFNPNEESPKIIAAARKAWDEYNAIMSADYKGGWYTYPEFTFLSPESRGNWYSLVREVIRAYNETPNEIQNGL